MWSFESRAGVTRAVNYLAFSLHVGWNWFMNHEGFFFLIDDESFYTQFVLLGDFDFDSTCGYGIEMGAVFSFVHMAFSYRMFSEVNIYFDMPRWLGSYLQ